MIYKMLCLMVFIVLLSSGVHAECVQEWGGDWYDSEIAIDELGSEMSSRFPVSLLASGVDIVGGLMNIEPLSLGDYSYTLWGTTYHPLYFIDFPEFDLFMEFARWIFMFLIIMRMAFHVVTNIL